MVRARVRCSDCGVHSIVGVVACEIHRKPCPFCVIHKRIAPHLTDALPSRCSRPSLTCILQALVNTQAPTTTLSTTRHWSQDGGIEPDTMLTPCYTTHYLAASKSNKNLSNRRMWQQQAIEVSHRTRLHRSCSCHSPQCTLLSDAGWDGRTSWSHY